MRAIASRYRIREQIGGGSFGTIYRGDDVKTGNLIAVKIESHDVTVPQLSNESKVYTALQGGVNVPRHHYFGRDNHHGLALVMDLEGTSIEELKKSCGGKMTLKTVLMLADQMIGAVEYMHNRGFIHRDIKPDNFVLGTENKENQLFLIDYGLSKNYRMPDGSHIVFQDGKPMTGTARYASINTLRGQEQSRRDDLESLAYIFFYLLNGALPWMNTRAPTNQIKYDKILAVKTITSPEELTFDNNLPEEFAKFLTMTRELGFSQTPDYTMYRNMFRDLFIRKGYIYDYKYDWVKDEPIQHKQQPVKQVDDNFNNKFITKYNSSDPHHFQNYLRNSNHFSYQNKSGTRDKRETAIFLHSNNNNHAKAAPTKNHNQDLQFKPRNDDLIRKKKTTSSTGKQTSINHKPTSVSNASHKKMNHSSILGSAKGGKKASATSSGVPKFHPSYMGIRSQTSSLSRGKK